MICSHCGATVNEGATFCQNCGQAIAAQPEQGAYQQQGVYQQPAYQQQDLSHPGRGLMIASLILGIVSLVLCFIPYITILTAIVGLILGIIGTKKVLSGQPKGMGIAGVICSAIGLVLAILLFVLAFFILKEAGFSDSINEILSGM